MFARHLLCLFLIMSLTSGCNTGLEANFPSKIKITEIPRQVYNLSAGNKLKIVGEAFDTVTNIIIKIDSDYCLNYVVINSSEIQCDLPSASTIKHQDVELTIYPGTLKYTYPKAIVRGVVLGQPDFNVNINKKLGVSVPYGLFTISNKLLMADSNNNRVLIWNTLPADASSAPDLVLGQPTLNSNNSNYYGLVSAKGMSSPRDIWSDGVKLIVSDYSNNRVLIWNSFPTNNHIQPDVVLGQPDFNTSTANNGPNTPACDNSANLNRCSLFNPDGVTSDGTRLFVSDSSNHRILIWTTIPTTNQEPADLVLGQPDFISNTSNNGPNNINCDSALGRNRCSLSSPKGLLYINNTLYVADSSNHRILMWQEPDAIDTNQEPADLVQGQPNFTSGTANNGPNTVPCGGALGRNACSLNTPLRVRSDGTKLFVTDINNARILIWDNFPSAIQKEANTVLGQPTMLTGTTDNGQNTVACGSVTGINLCSFNGASDLAANGTRLYALDRDRSRMLGFIYPLSSYQAANFVYGQAGSYTNGLSNGGAGVSATTLSNPMQIAFDGTRLFVSDNANHRVLIWHTLPLANRTAADTALGQPNLTTNTIDNGPNTVGCGGASGTNLCSLRSPQGIVSTGTELYVADTSNHRILYWSTIPTSHQKEATVALGQTTALTRTANNGPNTVACGTAGRNACSFSAPYGLSYANGKFVVADQLNHRILIFNSLPTVHPTAADLVLGQPDYLTGTANNTPSLPGTVSAQSLLEPRSAIYDGTRFYAVDIDNNRVLIWNNLPTIIQQAADLVIGQTSFSGASPTWVGNTSSQGNATSLCAPHHATIWNNNLVITDIGNSRLLKWDTDTNISTSANDLFGQTTMSTGEPNRGGIPDGLSLSYSRSSLVNTNYLFVVDSGNDRVLLLPNPW
jgi:hypothetical protein